MIQTNYDELMELMREVIYKGRSRISNRLIDLKAKALSPPQAKKASDLDKILTAWRHTKNDCGRRPEIQDGRRDDANKCAEDHALGIRENTRTLSEERDSTAGQYNYEEDTQEKSSSQGQAVKPHKW